MPQPVLLVMVISWVAKKLMMAIGMINKKAAVAAAAVAVAHPALHHPVWEVLQVLQVAVVLVPEMVVKAQALAMIRVPEMVIPMDKAENVDLVMAQV